MSEQVSKKIAFSIFVEGFKKVDIMECDNNDWTVCPVGCSIVIYIKHILDSGFGCAEEDSHCSIEGCMLHAKNKSGDHSYFLDVLANLQKEECRSLFGNICRICKDIGSDRFKDLVKEAKKDLQNTFYNCYCKDMVDTI